MLVVHLLSEYTVKPPEMAFQFIVIAQKPASCITEFYLDMMLIKGICSEALTMNVLFS